ncbi:MAG: type II toxin-antitoxin system VapC family toxin [Nitrososphaerales archaeon]
MDTNIWLYSFAADSHYGHACKHILDDLESGRLEATISIQVACEVSGVLYKSYGIRDTTKYVDAVLSYRMEIFPVTSEIVRSAASYAKEFKILPYDGIHIATAKEADCDFILSADRELNRQHVMRRVDPLDYKTKFKE